MLEKNIEQKVVKWCAKRGILNQKLLGKKGMPDRIFYFPRGHILFIEFKRPLSKVSALQERLQERLQFSGHHVYIIRDAENAIELLGKFLSIIHYKHIKF